MLFKSILTLVITTVSLTVFATTDTLVYRSPFEEKIIQQAIAGKNLDFLTLYSVINTDSAVTVRYFEKLNSFYASLDPKIVGAKSPKQKAKVIFKEVHDYFLKQYEEHTSFNNIFDNGRYNCVTGSMLYSIVLQKYGIPYDIKEKPTHVYVVAYPASDNILFETTNPKGFYVPNEKEKREYVDALVTVKFTTIEHVRQVGYANAFNEFYYNSDNISEVQLAALQYLNYALKAYQTDQPEDAITNILKTNLLFPSPKHQYLSLEMIGTALNNSKFDNPRHVMYMCEYANACRDVADKRNAISIFEQIIRKRLMENNDEQFVVNAYSICREKIRDSTLMRDISYDYYYAMAYSSAIKSDYDNALQFATSAYKINPKNVNVHEIILRAVMLKTDEIPVAEKASTIEKYGVTFPFLESNKSYKALLIYAYAYQCYTFFSQNSEVEGYAFMKKAEAAMKTSWNKIPMMEQLIGLMYAEAGAYHFRKQQYEKAKQILLAGLNVMPDHPEIRARLEIVENEQMRPSGWSK
jgi:tetratricopeptide (TPR) repeat protein